MTTRVASAGSLAASATLLWLAATAFGGRAEPAAPDFERDVRPILARACLECHGAKRPQGRLSLVSREAAIRGGLSGPGIVPGDPHRSPVVTRLFEKPGLPVMPPDDPLAAEEIAVLSAWVAAGAPWPAAVPVSAATAVDFTADVHPILSARCVRCHGPAQQKNGLRLDTHAAILRGGRSGPAVVPGQSAASELIRRVGGEAKPRMPFTGPPLSESQIATLRAWVDGGARGPAVEVAAADAELHWAYVRPVRREPPAVRQAAWVRNPIDAFVLARLEREGLAPAPEASRETLLRRVSLDLTGLPPTIAELDAFLADRSPDAYEKAVDRLLASPHYGERQARPWLDLARYADTHGYEKDRRRTAWKWRDWVIAALNADMPFRQFTVEQLAGDLLPDPTTDQLVATGFHRNTQLNQEGGIDVEEARWETLVDRVNTTATVWLGTTLACAQCHDHKFDPFSQKDYYRMLAFFDNGEYQAPGEGPRVVDRWIVEPEIELPTPEQAARKKELDAEIASVKARLETPTPELEAAQARWEDARRGRAPAWTTLQPQDVLSAGGATLEVAADGTVTVSGTNPDRDTYTVVAPAPEGEVTGFRLDALAEPPFGNPGRADYGAFVLTRFSAATAAAPAVPVAWARAEADGEGSLAGAIDDDEATGWGHYDPNRSRTAVFQPAAAVPGSTRLTLTLEHRSKKPQHALRRFRLYVTTAANPWGGLPLPEKLQAILVTPAEKRSEEQAKELSAFYRSLAPELEKDRRRLSELQKAVADLAIPTALVLRERPGGQRPSTPLRGRGSYLSPGERVFADVPEALNPLPASAMPNRLGLALWLTDDSNPLTARVAVNRVWEQYFGRGLVATSEDFGTQGELPTHPELLDWLATELHRMDTRMKPLHRLIVTSATYRQSSRLTPLLRERDPDNRLLARGPRFRVEAETVRDIALAASGLLSRKVGGPSVFPHQPEGIWDNPYSDDRWELSAGGDRYRRGLYTFVRRTAPYPALVVFDAPSREQCTVRRVRTNTPLQALTTLNDPAYFEAARVLARRTLREAGTDARARLGHAFRLCTARRPRPAETDALLAFERREQDRFAADAAAARAVAGEESGGAAELAAWTMVASVLLNLDETLTKE